jgi:hypothetical protein
MLPTRARQAGAAASMLGALMLASAALGVEVTDEGIYARMQVGALQGGKLKIPSGVRYVLLEAGCSDMDTLAQDVLPQHPEGMTLSLEPLLDKYSYLVGNASAKYHGKNGLDLTVPLGHAEQRSVVLPLAVSEDGGTQKIYVSPIAGCSSLAKVNRGGTWANGRCRSVVETRLVDSIRLVDAIGLVPPSVPILRLKLDVQGIDFRLVRSVPPPVLQSRVVFLDVEVRKNGCATLYQGQENCSEVLQYMHSIDFEMVLPGARGASRVLHGCQHLPYDNACEANARFRSKAQKDAAASFPLPYRVGKERAGLPRVEEEHG